MRSGARKEFQPFLIPGDGEIFARPVESPLADFDGLSPDRALPSMLLIAPAGINALTA
ncbi:MAG: hypothetical protein AB1631_18470 [Acidobacteriota bacterium]